MNKLSYVLATFAIIGVSILPANAVEKEINTNTIVTDATEQIKESTHQSWCRFIPGHGWVGPSC